MFQAGKNLNTAVRNEPRRKGNEIRSQRKEKGLGSSAEVERLALNKNKRAAHSLRH